MSEVQTKKPKPSKNKLILGIQIAGLSFVALILIGIFTRGTPPSVNYLEGFGLLSNSTAVHLHASSSFDGTEFIISNINSFDWLDVQFELDNPPLLSGGYLFSIPKVAANTTFTVEASRFAMPDGTHFDPYKINPINISITCKTVDNKSGYWYGYSKITKGG